MESNKNGFENLKLLFDDVIDTLIESNSGLLQQIEDLKNDVGILNDKLDFYKEKIQKLEERVAGLDDKIIPDNSFMKVESVEIEEIEETEEIEELQKEPEQEQKEENNQQETGDQQEEEEEILFIIDDKYINQQQKQEGSAPEILFPDLYTQAKAPATEVKKTNEVEQKLIMDTVKPEWYDWEVDYPAPYVEDIASAIGFNDRLVFLKDLFNGNQEKLIDTINNLNKMELFSDAVDYMRENFSYWNEQSDEVYRFYMLVRRKLRK